MTQIATGFPVIFPDATAGTAEASKALVVGADKSLDWTFTSASTDGATSVEVLTVETTLTGIGGVGGRAHFKLSTNVALGGWSNALKGEVTYGAAGRTNGLGSAVVAEMTLSAGTTQGNYAPFEAELNLGTGAKCGTLSSFMHLSCQGDGVGEFDDNGVLLSLNGITIGSTHLVQASAVSNIDSTHALKIAINGTIYYLPLHTAANFGG